jgi:tRNA dimethylallyltransferase
LLELIRSADPVTAERLDRRNARRIVRAAEVLELTGRPPSELRTSWDKRDDGPYQLVVAGLSWDRDELIARAAERVRRQFEDGLLEEVRRIGSANFSRTARQALGVKEMIPVIEGDEDIETASERLTRNTKSFIRRQLSWFGADPRAVWFNASELGFDGAREGIIDLFSRAI